MTFEQLQYFVTAATSSSFLDAAEQLYTTQSTLSKQIRKLEAELGVTLYDRSRRSARLTPAGEVFYKEAVSLLAAYERMQQTMQPYRTDAGNRLAIGTLPILSQYRLTSRIHQFTQQHPEITLSLAEVEEEALMHGLRHGTYELVIARASMIDQADYAFHPLAADRLCAILPADHRLATAECLSTADLADEALILMHPYTAIYALCVSLYAAQGLQPRILRTARMESILGAVASSEGISLLPESSYRLFQNTGTVAVPLTDAPALHVGIAHQKGRRLSPAAHAWMQFMESTSR